MPGEGERHPLGPSPTTFPRSTKLSQQTSAETLADEILDLSRQAYTGPLAPWLGTQLQSQIERGEFLGPDQLRQLGESLVGDLEKYRMQNKIGVVVVGMSGGVDSALTASLFKTAGWRVLGVTMPIHQHPDETERGIEACKSLHIEHVHKDLTVLFGATVSELADTDPSLGKDAGGGRGEKFRRGNVRARLRMITLYNLASLFGGLVGSTDNYSELAAGFWTLHGDVGDVSPIQSLLKSWEVPSLARMYAVPERTWRATPTDGLSILVGGDEAQLGCTYLEWDLMVNAIWKRLTEEHISGLEMLSGSFTSHPLWDHRAAAVFEAVTQRMERNAFKRRNPVMLAHKFSDRLTALAEMDRRLFAAWR